MSSSTVVQQPSAAARGVLPAECAKAITDYVGKANKVGKSLAQVADLLYSNGIKSDWLYSPKDNADDPIKVAGTVTTRGEFYAEFRDDVIAGFTKAEQALMEQAPKGLSDAKKAQRAGLKSDIGSRQKDIRNAVKRREDKADPDNAPSRTRSVEVRITECLNNARKYAELAEEPGFNVAAFCKHVDAALVVINGNADRDDGSE